MSVRREFLGWDGALLPLAAKLLAQRHAVSNLLDLGAVCVVVPGGRAGRRLVELLVEEAEGSKRILVPPVILTAGAVPELFFPSKNAAAPEMTRIAAWIEALGEAPDDELSALTPASKETQDFQWRLRTAEYFDRLYVELAGNGLGFGDVPEALAATGGEFEAPRWNALEALEGRMLEKLRAWGWEEKYRQRREAVYGAADCAARGLAVYLVGVADLPGIARRAVSLLSDEVTALIHAPAELCADFDDLGCAITDRWVSRPIEIAERAIRFCEDPDDLAAEVVAVLGDQNIAEGPEDVTVGVCESGLEAYLEGRLNEAGIRSRSAGGTALSASGPITFLRVASSYARDRRFADFAKLIRHPDVERWLVTGRGVDPQYLSAVDRWQGETVAAFIAERTESGMPAPVAETVRGVDELIGELIGKARPAAEWSAAIASVLSRLYSGRKLRRFEESDRITLEAIVAIRKGLEELALMRPEVLPRAKGADAVALILRQAGKESVRPEGDAAAVELLGWLELQLDDAPVLVVAGVNEGWVPETVNADAFLPDGLRRKLGLLCNERRLARDAYALSAMLASRPSVSLLVCRQSAKGDPLLPSRLLLASTPDRVASRLKRFVEHRTVVGPGAAASEESLDFYRAPRPVVPPGGVEKIGATGFRDYLACPYRFYLRHVLRLRESDDAALEADALLFGTVVHELMERFGRGEMAQSVDARAIREALLEDLGTLWRRRFGSTAAAAVYVQRKLLEFRLGAFADWQSAWRKQGWEIRSVEHRTTVDVATDHGPLIVEAKIDRIDFNPELEAWAVFDYKTGDEAKDPDAAHRVGRGEAKRWIDLQLPVYGEAARKDFTGGFWPALGYIHFGSSLDQICGDLAPWGEAVLEDGMRVARETAGKIRAGEFWPPASRVPFSDPFAEICGVSPYARARDVVDGGGEGGS